MDEALWQDLVYVGNEILEKVGRLDVEPCGLQEDVPVDSWDLDAWVEFSGSSDGAIHLRCDSSLMRQATANYLGTGAEAVTVGQVEDTAKELVNMLAGNFLALYRRRYDGTYSIGVPEVAMDCPDSAPDLAEDTRALLLVDSQAVGVTFGIKQAT